MKSGGSEALARDNLIWHFPHYRHAPGPYSIIRQGDLKLIHFWEGVDELYNLQNDLGEETNLAESNPEQVQKLHVSMVSELERMGAHIPRPNPDFKE